MNRRLFVAADPLVDTKTGVAYGSEYLLRRLVEHAGADVEIDLGYFDFRGTRGTPPADLGHARPQHRVPSAAYLKALPYGLAPPIEVLWRRRYDATLSTNYYLMPAAARRTHEAVIIHDLGYLLHPEYLRPGRRGVAGRVLPSGPDFLRRVVPRAARRADTIVTWTATVRSEMAEHLGIEPELVVVAPIFPDHHFEPDADAVPPERFGLNKPFVLCQATIEPRKNHGLLVEAFARLPDHVRRDHSLVFAGGVGWSSDRLLARIAERQAAGDDVRMLGYVSEAERLALYQSCRVAVLCSHYEGFGMPALEALACGAPTICSDIPVLREVGGSLAAYVDRHDPDDLAAALSMRLAGPPDRVMPTSYAAHVAALDAQHPSDTLCRRLGLT